MSACTEPNCGGSVADDGYCDTCGARAGGASVPVASAPAAAVAPAGAVPGSNCLEPGCGGSIAADGYCDTCGTRAGSAAVTPASSAGAVTSGATSAPPSIAAPRPPGTSQRVGTSSTSRRTGSSRTGSTRGRLGAGLLEVTPTPTGDPAAAVMSEAKIKTVLGVKPEDERNCSSCGQPVGRSVNGREGRATGFCSNCRTPFDFHTNAPQLVAGEMVAGQYEILGPLAHGGMGWIYLGRDKAVSDRWVVLKGLLNDDDPDALIAAVAERQFLAQIEHPNIVNIYNFVTHRGRGYIVMEFVGGESLNSKLKDRRKANNNVPDPLPPADAIAYVLGVLPAFGYLHQLGLVYNDLKPANVMSVGDDVKLIDVGAVMRADDQQAAIFGTQGFQAPEVAEAGPSVASDIYTIGRTLAVLVLSFTFHTGQYQYAVPPPREFGVLRQWESLHRFLLKACAHHADDRFQSTAAMTEQLTGVLREIVTVTQQTPRPVPSHLFGGDRLTGLLAGGADVLVTAPDWRTLPFPKVARDDPGAALLEDLVDVEPTRAMDLIQAGLADGSLVDSPETRLRQARAMVELGRDPESFLASVEADDPWDWRIGWYRSLSALALGDAARAAEGFSAVWTEVPGELAPRLGAALAAEQAGEYQRAAELYERVVAIDTTYVSGAFGLARCAGAAGDRRGAVAAFQRVPPSSATYTDAQVAAARALVASAPQPEELEAAAQTVERLQLDAQRGATLASEILERALAAQRDGTLRSSGATLFGHPMNENGLRRGLEATYRELARLATDSSEKVRLVDQANAVRPRTLV